MQYEDTLPLIEYSSDLTPAPVDEHSLDVYNNEQPSTPTAAAATDANEITLENMNFDDATTTPRKKRNVSITNAATCINRNKFITALNNIHIHTMVNKKKKKIIFII